MSNSPIRIIEPRGVEAKYSGPRHRLDNVLGRWIEAQAHRGEPPLVTVRLDLGDSVEGSTLTLAQARAFVEALQLAIADAEAAR